MGPVHPREHVIPEAPYAGALVTPSIRLTRLLGQGGMGSVWLAEHLRLQTEVVVKFMAAEYAVSEEAMRRFEREATLAAQAKSPNVVQVFDHGVSSLGLPYIAMERLVGEDLGRRIERVGRIDPHVFAGWLKQACNGLSRAHQKGIVHRDIKPENVFLCDEDGEVLVKILDFGIAKSANPSANFSGTRTGAIMGTAYYMSPEQTMGARDIDWRSDLWAMGVITYYAVTGVRPFEAEAIGALVVAITQAPIAPPSTKCQGMPPAIDRFIEKALARAPAERFQSAKELAEAFTAALSGDSKGVVAAPATAVSGAPHPGVPTTDPRSSPSGNAVSAVPARSNLGSTTTAPSVRSSESRGRSERRLYLGGAIGVLIVGGAAAIYALGLRAPDENAAETLRATPLAVTSTPPNHAAPISAPAEPMAEPAVQPTSAASTSAAPIVGPAPLSRPVAPKSARTDTPQRVSKQTSERPAVPASPSTAPPGAVARPIATNPPSAKASPSEAKKSPLQMNIE